MIEIRNKRQKFYENVRKSQKQLIKSKLRKDKVYENQIIKINEYLRQIFQSCYIISQQNKLSQKFERNSNKNHFCDIFYLVDRACQKLKQLIEQNEKKNHLIECIALALFQNLPLMISSEINLNEIPNSFIEISLWILKNQLFSRVERQEFISNLNFKILNRCLLQYFYDNWQQIKLNKCNDFFLKLFYEVTKYKNIFQQFQYNQQIYGFFINQLVNQILACTQLQRKGLQSFQTIIDSFKYSLGQYRYSNFSINRQILNNEQEVYNLIKKVFLLCNLLLLCPLKNFDIKEIQHQLHQILNYLYKYMFLNEDYKQYKICLSYSISVLTLYTVNQLTKQHFRYLKVLLKQDTEKSADQTETNNFDNNQQIQLCPQQYYLKQNQFEFDKEFVFQAKRIKFLMICVVAQFLHELRLKDIYKWIIHHFKNKNNNIFDIENPLQINSFFKMFVKLIKNQKSQSYSSYHSYKNNYINKNQDEVLQVKRNIFNIIELNGFKQLINHKNLRFYGIQLANLFTELTNDLNYEEMIQNQYQEGKCKISKKSLSQQNQQNESLNEELLDIIQCQKYAYNIFPQTIYIFKQSVFELSQQFLQKGYKYLDKNSKSNLLYELVMQRRIGEEQCRKYLTEEQMKKFEKRVDSKGGNKSSDCSECSSLRSSNQRQDGKQGIEDKKNAIQRKMNEKICQKNDYRYGKPFRNDYCEWESFSSITEDIII